MLESMEGGIMKYCCKKCKGIFNEKEIIMHSFYITGLTPICENCNKYIMNKGWY
jgi:NAD-dependent SIR2 family protein deacetylase